MKKDDLIVVTGAGGFIGGHLVAELVKQGYKKIRAVDKKYVGDWWQQPVNGQVEVVDGHDLSLPTSCHYGATWVFQLACDMGGIGFIEQNKAKCMQSVVINANLLKRAHLHGVKRYFFSSSACVYPQRLQSKVCSDAVAQGDNMGPLTAYSLRECDVYPADPEDGYGWEKLFSERMCRHYREDFGLETRIARLHNVYGPYGSWDDGREKAPAAICRKIALAKITNSPAIEVWGDGNQLRSFMFISDCIEGILRIMMSDYHEPLNLGSDRVVTVNQLIDIVEKIAGTKLARVYKPDAPKGVRARNSDNTLIRERLGWAPSITLEQGLEKTYAWIYDQIRKKMCK